MSNRDVLSDADVIQEQELNKIKLPNNYLYFIGGKYHTSGTWNGLTYTATSENNAAPLSFTIPTGTTATTVALGNHTHSGYATETWTNSQIATETTRATSQENKSLYHLGAYDSISDNTITRQTGYFIINAEDITSTSVETAGGSNAKFVKTKHNGLPVDMTIEYGNTCGVSSNGYGVTRVSFYWIGNPQICINNTGIQADNYVCISNNAFTTVDEFKALCPIYIQYKLATSYTEDVIDGATLLPLDSGMATELRELITGGLNLWDGVLTQNGDIIFTPSISGDYTLSCNTTFNQLDCYNSTDSTYVKREVNKSNITVNLEANKNYLFASKDGSWGAFTRASNIMLVKSNHAYPYEKFNGKLARIPYVNKSLYHLGAYDTVGGDTITRQTGYLTKKDFKYTGANVNGLTQYYTDSLPTYYVNGTTTSEVVNNANYSATSDVGQWNATSYGLVAITGDRRVLIIAQSLPDDLQIQYKLATSYTEQVIEGESILPLDSNMANKIRQDVVDGLNLLDYDTRLIGKGVNDSTGVIEDYSEGYLIKTYLKPNTVYSYSGGVYIYEYTSNGSFLGRKASTPFITNADTSYILFSAYNTATTPMLVEGSHTYPYEKFNGKLARIPYVDSKDNKSLYHLGAFDIVKGNTITRQTGYIDLGSLNWTYDANYSAWYSDGLLSTKPAISNSVKANIVSNKYTTDTVNNIISSGHTLNTIGLNNITNTNIWVYNGSSTIKPSGLLQYELVDNLKYTEDIVGDESILPLDSDMASELREQVVDGLNLADFSLGQPAYIDFATGTITVGNSHWCSPKIYVNPNTKYTVSYTKTQKVNVFFYSANGTYLDPKPSEWSNNTPYTFTTPNNVSYMYIVFYQQSSSVALTYGDVAPIMLTQSAHPYPYEKFNGKLARIPYVNKALYHLGAYDSVSGNTITRRTGYVDNILELNYNGYMGRQIYQFYAQVKDASPFQTSAVLGTNVVGTMMEKKSSDELYTGNYTAFAELKNSNNENFIFITVENCTTQEQVIAWIRTYMPKFQYKLATSYTEAPIENQSILPLDNNMANKIRQDVVDGLNLADNNLLIQGKWTVNTVPVTLTSATNRITFNEPIPMKQNVTYTLNNTGNKQAYIVLLDNNLGNIETISWAGNPVTFTTNSNETYFIVAFRNSDDSDLTVNDVGQVMLVEATHVYPYEPYHASKHITNDEATLLKQEWEKGLNLFDYATARMGGYYHYTTGAWSYNSSYMASGYIEVLPNTTYSANVLGHICYYDNSQNFISGAIMQANGTLTTPSNCKYMIYSPATKAVIVMLNKGTTALPYQPYNGAIIHEKDIEPTLLWENGSPTSDFARQTLSNLPDMSKYKYIVVAYKYHKGSNNAIQYEKANYYVNDYVFISKEHQANSEAVSRVLQIVSSTSVTINDGYCNRTANNSFVIPVAIYGTNIL